VILMSFIGNDFDCDLMVSVYRNFCLSESVMIHILTPFAVLIVNSEDTLFLMLFII